MPLLDDLPSVDQFGTILSRLIGDADDGTSLSALSQILSGVNGAELSASTSGQINAHASASITVDVDALTGSASGAMQSTISNLNTDPGQLLAPLLGDLEGLTTLLQGDLLGTLSGAFDGFNQVQAAAPSDSNTLIQLLLDGLNTILSEFSGGRFSELREWSSVVTALGDELTAVMGASGDTVQARLIAYLSDKIALLLSSLMPQEGGPAVDFDAQINAILSTDRLNAIVALSADLTAQYNAVIAQFGAANFTDDVALVATTDAITAWTSAIDSLLTDIDGVLGQPVFQLNGLIDDLGQRYSDIEQAEVVNLNQVREFFVEVINDIRTHVDSLGLEGVRDDISGFFDQVSGFIESAQIEQLAEPIENIETQISEQVTAVEGQLLNAVTTLRASFEQAQSAIRDLLGALGTFDGDDFEFHVQADIEAFIEQIRTTLNDTVRPILESFQTGISDALGDAETLLTNLQAQVQGVKDDIQALFQGANDTLEAADVPAIMERMAGELDAMISQLGDISFDPVVDVVVGELDDMAGQLGQIDVSSLNEITVGALKVSLTIVTELDFSVEVTDLLMEQIDALLELPQQGIGQLQNGVEMIQEAFSQLDPDVLMNVLDELLEPINTALDALDLNVLLQPINDWYEGLTSQLDALSVNTLIQPLIDLYQELTQALQRLSPELLLEDVVAAINDAVDVVQSVSLASLQAQAEGAMNQARETLDRFAPETLLAPALAPFETIEGTISDFRPSTLLEPVLDLFESLTAPLAAIDQSHVDAVVNALRPLQQFPDALDPTANINALHAAMGSVVTRLNGIGFNQNLAQLNSLNASVQADFDAGAASASVSASVEVINPLRNADITALSAHLQQTINRLQNAFPSTDVPEALQTAYDGIAERVQSLAPAWLSDDLTPASFRDAILAANPLNVGAELDELYDDLTGQILALSPTSIVDEVQDIYDQLIATIDVIDPAALLGSLNDTLTQLTGALDILDPNILVDELTDIFDDLMAVVAALDPTPIADQLQTVLDDVVALLGTLNPATLLTDIEGPLNAVKALLGEFSVEEFKAPVRELFENIENIIGQIDIAVLLSPITNRLQDLRDELEEGLGRTQTSFNGMLAAIPV